MQSGIMSGLGPPSVSTLTLHLPKHSTTAMVYRLFYFQDVHHPLGCFASIRDFIYNFLNIHKQFDTFEVFENLFHVNL